MNDRLRYLWDDFASRPERVRLTAQIGFFVGSFALFALIIFFSRGQAKPARATKKAEAAPIAAPAPQMKDAFAYAKSFDAAIRDESRFARVYLVPSAADSTQRYGKVVIMGEVATDSDLRALEAIAVKHGSPVALEWQVSVASSSH